MYVYVYIYLQPSVSDMESIDPDFYKSLRWMLDNSIDGVIDQTFSIEEEKFGETETIDLIPDGQNIAVTDENKEEYDYPGCFTVFLPTLTMIFFSCAQHFHNRACCLCSSHHHHQIR